MRETVSFVLSGSNVLCEYCFPEALWAVEIDEGQISQVLSNIIINADQAMPEGGTIYVKAENETIEPSSMGTMQPGNYVRISVRDKGTGIPEEYLPKIFDPYFTTKQKGSGLGLASGYSIVKKHKGYISVESKLGQGTTFHILLPACCVM